MKKTIQFILMLLTIITFYLVLFKEEKEPKRLAPKFEIIWKDKKISDEFRKIGLPFLWPSDLLTTKGHFYATEFVDDRIQVFTFSRDGNLLPRLLFGKKNMESWTFFVLRGFTNKGSNLYVVDSGNQRIQVLGINSDGSLSSRFVFGKGGKGLGEFSAPTGLTVKGNYLYVADSGNQRIQVLGIK